MSALFISYASDDQSVALELCGLLEARGLSCWIAPRDVAPGAVWDEAILDAIGSAHALVLILSSHANESPFVKNEVNRAFSQCKPIVTLRVENVLPSRSLELYLARHHWTDAFPLPVDRYVDRLAAALHESLGAAGEEASVAMAMNTVGAYRLDERIGQSGSGEVFKAFDTLLNRAVAVKVMRQAKNDAPAVQQFLREAREASALNHPNILTIHEIGETPSGDRFVVQELVDGQTLRSMFDGAMPIRTIVEIGRQIARALAAAHERGIVHRGLRPENVVVRTDGCVKVLNFSVGLQGPTSYVSPEEARGDPTGPPVDVFALGIVLYEMAAGRRPFEAPTPVSVIAAILSEQPLRLARVNPAIPLPLDALVQRMLDKEPGRRPSAQEVDAALGALAQQDALSTPSQSAAVRRTVGREAERASLRKAYARVKAGRGLLLAVSGEAGIGKTSLVEDFLRELTEGPERPIVTRGRCSEQLAGAEAYLPLLEALDNLLCRGGIGAVDTVMKTVAPTWYAQLAPLAADSTSNAGAHDRPAPSQERMKRELGAFFHDISQPRPVVIAIEDLHWADVSTVDMLNYLAGRFADMRVLVVVTYRAAEMALAQHPFLGITSDLRSRGVFEDLPLGFLELRDVERYLAIEFPGHAFPPDFAAMIGAKTEGNPLFMADLVRYVQDSGGIVQQNGQWVVAWAGSNSPRDLPASVRGLIARKIERLDDADRRLLVAASVQGHEFDSATVAEAVEMDPGQVEERLDALERVHVFVTRGDEQEFPDRTPTLTYQFVHVLYQNVLYASLLPTRRTTLSGRVARALAAHSGTDTSIAGRLALLFEAARDPVASAQYFFTATQHAIGLFAFREALSLADRGLNVLSASTEGAQRKQQELGLQMMKGVALRSTTGWATVELEHTFARARQLCQELGDPPQVFPVMWATTLFHLIRGNLLECRTRADELMVKAAETGTPALLMAAHHMAGVSREFIGDMVESSRLLERARELHDPAEHHTYTAMYGLDPGMIARAMSSRPLWVLGYLDRALERGRETLAIARSQRQPLTHVFALMVLQGVMTYRGDGDEAVTVGEECIALCREHQLPQEAEWSRSFQGSALIALGRTDEGIDLLKDSLAVQQRLETHLSRTTFLALLADGFRQAGRIDEGLAAVDEGFLWAERTAEGGYVAELHRMRGELLRLTGNNAAAEESLRTAIAYAARQQAKTFELRAATGLARLLMASGRAPEARAMLAPVYRWFTEGHGTTDLVTAQALLSEIG